MGATLDEQVGDDNLESFLLRSADGAAGHPAKTVQDISRLNVKPGFSKSFKC
jgi:hypothetical protein